VAAVGLMQGFARSESKQGEGSGGLATETMIFCDGPDPVIVYLGLSPISYSHTSVFTESNPT
jgi:hypothetical protein